MRWKSRIKINRDLVFIITSKGDTKKLIDLCSNFGVNDIIEMTLDMRSNNKFGVLSTMINDIDQGIVDNEIDIEKEYFMRVVQLLSV